MLFDLRFSELKNEVLDCTCPVLKNIYKKIEEKYNLGYEIIIVGDKTHPEVIGLTGLYFFHNRVSDLHLRYIVFQLRFHTSVDL